MTSQREETLARLSATLGDYLRAVPLQTSPNAPDLLALFKQLDALELELDSSFDAQLRHYMHQKSYRKAHLYLQDRDEENLRGNCGKK